MSWCIRYLIVVVALWATQVDCLVSNPRHQNIRDVPVVGYMPSLIALQQPRQRKLQLHMSDKDREYEIRRKVSGSCYDIAYWSVVACRLFYYILVFQYIHSVTLMSLKYRLSFAIWCTDVSVDLSTSTCITFLIFYACNNMIYNLQQ